MKIFIEAFVTSILIALAAFVCAGFINVELQINQAKEFHNVCIGEIETSDFNEGVILQLKTDAANRGYTLNVDTTKNQEYLKCMDCNQLYSKTEGRCPTCKSLERTEFVQDRMAVVNLSYKIKFPLIGIEKGGVLHGMAR